MIEPAIVLVRLLQYSGAMVLGGSSLFFLYAAPRVWPRRLLASAALALVVTSLLAVGLQGALLSGSLAEGFKPEVIVQVVTFLPLGKAALVRAAVALAALVAIAVSDTRWARFLATTLGLVAAASLAWMGHAGAGEGWAQIAANTGHVLAAAVWLGALAGLLLLAWLSRIDAVHHALERFSVLGVAVVAILALSGLVNSWYLVGPDHLRSLPTSRYGQLLLAKLAAFAAMLGLAALNRYRLTPALVLRPGALTDVRRSLAIEALLGLAVLALVAWLGTLEPPAAL